MAGFVGGVMAVGGFIALLQTVPEIGETLAERAPGTTTQKVLQLAANVLKMVGEIALAVAAIVAGATTFSAPSSIMVAALAHETLHTCAPYLMAGVGGLVSSRVIEIIK